ncbi:FAD-binding protein [Adhaeretor mobilis]|uniref:Putative FAD-linked oxidoreductase n=1 Tax=Adhaeretor mobilis TaxID=1930276 RepID=A0A517MXF5_9BACT|nr:FAD-binding protein [Adhaeretor mobilis]QDS99562.1 putative FAD-linked oxidoreductase [Adhaeretor mobilis]
METIETTEQLTHFVRNQAQVRVRAGGTKPATSGNANVSLVNLSGVIEYESSEFTITVRAGTPLAEIENLLAEQRQYLPFDPPLARAGATIGGTVATGLSGSGRFRYGGVRDFLLGVRFVTGEGQLVQLGSKVVKNAAGFDFPKLMVGGLGRFGIMTELTLKVFPAPEATRTVVLENDNQSDALETMLQLAASQLDLTCLDLDDTNRIRARVAGSDSALLDRVARLQQFSNIANKVIEGEEELALWQAVGEFQWVPAGYRLVKVALAPEQIPPLISDLTPGALRICAGGHLGWIAWPQERPGEELDRVLAQHCCPGLAITGDWHSPLIGEHQGSAFARRLTLALDPESKFTNPQPVV